MSPEPLIGTKSASVALKVTVGAACCHAVENLLAAKATDHQMERHPQGQAGKATAALAASCQRHRLGPMCCSSLSHMGRGNGTGHEKSTGHDEGRAKTEAPLVPAGGSDGGCGGTSRAGGQQLKLPLTAATSVLHRAVVARGHCETPLSKNRSLV